MKTYDLLNPTGAPESIEQIVINAELQNRPLKVFAGEDYKKEASAFAKLAEVSARSPEKIFLQLVESMLDLCEADSAGISLLEQSEAKSVLRWRALAGQLTPFLNRAVPRGESPCSYALESLSPQLIKAPIRHFRSMSDLGIPVHEMLVVPLVHQQKSFGTLWVMSHRPDKKFSREHLRILNSFFHFASIAYGLTKRLEASEEARSSENIKNQNLWLEEVLNRLPIGLIMAEPGSAKYRFTNRAARMMLGQDPKKSHPNLAMDKLIVRNINEEVLSLVDIPSARAARGEELVNEVIILDKGDTRLFVSCNSNTIPAMYGRSETILIPFLDISDLKAKEAKLTFERHQLETIFQRSPAAMALWRGPDFIFEKVNPEYQAIFPDRELLGKTFLEAIPEFKDQAFTELLTTVLETGEPFVGREILARHARHAGGPIEDHYYDFTYMRVNDAQGKPYGVYDHAIDVTSRVMNQKRLEVAKLEAERANEFKSAFLANMSHEIRTPLGAMIGFADLLRDPCLTPLEHTSYLDVLSRNGEQLSYIINDILDLSKVEAGHLTLEFLPTSPDVVATEVLSLLLVKAKEKNLELEYITDESTPQEITSDPGRIRQVLINLVGNAIKFTQQGSIKIKSFSFQGSSGKTMTAFEITDTGVGVCEDQKERIFEMFVQGDGSMTRRFGGTGIGLSLSRKLARAIGGDIRLKSSRLGEGSTFLFTFQDQPEKRESSLERAKAKDGSHNFVILGEKPLHGLDILVVDDSPDNQQLIWHFLTRAGATVDAAENGVEGYKKALAGNHHLILMDIQMPLMDGYTATQRLRELGFRKPIIALTAHAMSEVRKKCLNVGYTDHLPKPINPKDLVAAIARYTSHS